MSVSSDSDKRTNMNMTTQISSVKEDTTPFTMEAFQLITHFSSLFEQVHHKKANHIFLPNLCVYTFGIKIASCNNNCPSHFKQW
jgi:hypothetical protein